MGRRTRGMLLACTSVAVCLLGVCALFSWMSQRDFLIALWTIPSSVYAVAAIVNGVIVVRRGQAMVEGTKAGKAITLLYRQRVARSAMFAVVCSAFAVIGVLAWLRVLNITSFSALMILVATLIGVYQLTEIFMRPPIDKAIEQILESRKKNGSKNKEV